MNERFRNGHTDFAPSPIRHDLMVFAPDALAVLTDVREKSGLFLLDHRTNVDVGVWKKAFSLTSGVDFKEIQRGLPETHPRADREYARNLMIHVRVHRPVRENDVGMPSGEEDLHCRPDSVSPSRHRARVRMRVLDLDGNEINLLKGTSGIGDTAVATEAAVRMLSKDRCYSDRLPSIDFEISTSRSAPELTGQLLVRRVDS